MRGSFIVFDGGEGAGKTTNLEYAADWLRRRGHKVLVTREPGGTSIGEIIRGVILAEHPEPMCSATELLLLFASRAQHVEAIVKPALERGEIVLCSRFTSATYAYQGAGRGFPIDKIAALEAGFQGGIAPDLTVIFDLDPAKGMARAYERAGLDRIEKEKLEFFMRVRADYRRQSRENPERFALIDAGLSLAGVQVQLVEALVRAEPQRCPRLCAESGIG